MLKTGFQFASLPLLMAGCAVGPVWAQAKPDQPAAIEKDDRNSGSVSAASQILVVGDLPTSISETSEAIVSVAAAPAERIENALRDVAGVQQFRRSDARSANPTSQGVTLRGLGGNASSRALLFVDGVPQADPFGGWISWPQYDALNLASIRVRRGGGQVNAGPGAIAGVIELDSQQARPRNFMSARYGSRNSAEAQAVGMFNLGEGQISASGSYARGDGFTPIRQSQRGSVDRQAPYEQAAVNLRATAPVSDDVQMQANIRGFFDERDRGFDFSDNQNSGVDASLRFANLRADFKWSALAYVQMREFATRFGSVASDRNSVRLVLDQFSVPSTGLGARFELRPPVGGNTEIRIGADWRRTIGETNERFFFIGDDPQRSRNAGGRTDTLGAFLQGSWRSDNQDVTLTAGGRIDRWFIANGSRRQINLATGEIQSDERFADRNGWQGTGRVGAAWRPDGGNFALRASGYLGWRLPTLNELYRPFRVGAVTTAANETLRPERVKGAEIGFQYGSPQTTNISVTVFRNRLDNAIANVTLDDRTGNNRQRQNLDAIDSQGVEVDASVDLSDMFGVNRRVQKVTVRASYAYIDARVRGRDDALALDGLRPAQVPQHFGSFSLDYNDRAGLKAGASLRYLGRQFEDDTNSLRLDDALTVDGWLGYMLGKNENLTIEARAENIFDAEVQAGISGDGIIERTRPRTFWFGLRVKL